jgi:hypothetical protein
MLFRAVVSPESVQSQLERKTAAVLAYLAVEGETPKYKLAGLSSLPATSKCGERQ